MQKRDEKGRFAAGCGLTLSEMRKRYPHIFISSAPRPEPEGVWIDEAGTITQESWDKLAAHHPYITPALACAAYSRADALREAAKAVGCFGLGFVIGMWG